MVGIIYVGDLKYCPYLSKYVDVLEEYNIKYEVLYWSLECVKSEYSERYISFDNKSNLNRHPALKAKDFFLFRCWLKKKITLRKYKKLIVLSTLSGIIISDVLLKEYSNKYIFDIRDYSYEHYRIFLKKEEDLIRNSNFTCISSEGFKRFLPKGYEYKTVHNIIKKDLDNNKNFVKKPYGSTLNVAWIGSIRYFEHQKKIIDKLCHDNRFKLTYHGTGPELELYRKYCQSKGISKITFTGEYNNNDKPALLGDADILNNTYNTNKIMETKYAISNKYYDGLIFGIPQLVETDTFKSAIVKENGVGIGIDPDNEDFSDRLYNYYFSIDEKAFNSCCENTLEKTLMEEEIYINYINRFLNNGIL